MAYGADIDTNLSPDHRWDFDGDSTDQVGSANGTDTSMVYTSSGICKDVTNCAETDAITDRVSVPTTTDINNSAQSRKSVGGWFMPTAIQNPPKNIYGEGDATQAFRFILGWGNYLMFEVDAATSVINQIFADVPLDPDRAYHMVGLFEGNAYSNEVKFFLDGIEQLNANPLDREPDVASIPIRGVAEFGDPAGTVAVGGTAVILIAPINGKWNEWCTWDGASAILSDSDIRVELFEKGALGDVVISSGTESAMQTALDVYADTVRSNAACCIEIQAVTGDGDLSLDLDNITFNSLASIHIKYLGTGTLTLVNTNGANAELVKCSAPWGTVEVENPATLTINGLINGCEIRVYDDNGVDANDFGDALTGTETLSGTSYDYDHPGVANDIVIQMIADNYREIVLRRTLGATDQTVTVVPIIDEND